MKILIDKGFFNEAKLHCKKIIQKANATEEFEILTSAYKEYWNLHLLNRALNTETNLQIKNQLDATYNKSALEELPHRKVSKRVIELCFNL